MPIEFPPPPVPLQGELGTLQADATQGAVVVLIGVYRLLVHAPGVLEAQQIKTITAGLEDLSVAIRALTAAAQRNGVLAPRTLYARSGGDVYVSISAGRISGVDAPKPLAPYFDDLRKDQPISLGEFEKRRLLASIHASRMGENYSPQLVAGEGDGYRIHLKPGVDAVNQGSVRVNLSNTGNRFTGREFLDLEGRRGTAAGDEFSILARAAAKVLEFDDVEPGSDYHETQLGYSRVNPLGLFVLSARYLDYRQQVQNVAFNGELWTVDLGYTSVLRSSVTSRITVQGKADYIYKRLELDSDGQQLQQEPYASLETGAAWSNSFRLLSHSWLGLAALTVRKGLGDVGSTAQTRADLRYLLARPSFSLRSQGTALTGELQLALQYADVTVPEQQQWIVGGIGNLQAYVPGVAIGDRGLLLRAVAEYKPAIYDLFSIKPRVFAEFAAAEYAETVNGVPKGVRSLSDVGAELVIGFGPYLETALTAALPLSDHGVARQLRDDARADFFFRLTAKF